MNFGVIAASLSLGLTVDVCLRRLRYGCVDKASGPRILGWLRQPQTRPAAQPPTICKASVSPLLTSGLFTTTSPANRRKPFLVILSLPLGAHSQFAHAQYYADRGQGSDRRPVKGFQVRQANGRQDLDRRSSQPGDHGHHHQARSRTIERARPSYDNSGFVRHAAGWRQFRREHLVHATAIEIDNLKAPAINVEAIAHRW